jgi:FHS family L-fucose permease-like MFS transporter
MVDQARRRTMSRVDSVRVATAAVAAGKSRRLLVPFLLVASLFFIWGFCHAMLDVLNKHFQGILHLSKAQSGLIQTSVFGAYFLMAMPSALLIRRIGYQKGILVGLVAVALGAFLFVPAGTVFKTFGAFLFALFVLSSGLACIETAANPYVTVLGPKEGAAGRLSVAQAFNSVAYILAPMIGGTLLFNRHPSVQAGTEFESLLIPYVALGFIVLVVFAVFSFIRLPQIDAESGEEAAVVNAAHATGLWQQRHFVWGLVTQFLYIAAQVGVNAFALNYILENAITKTATGEVVEAPLFSWYRVATGSTTPEATAAYVVTIAMFLYAIGRFTAPLATKLMETHRLLFWYGAVNCVIIVIVMLNVRQVSWMILPFCWLFMSIMFPFIFAMSLRNLGTQTKLAASFQIMSIVGGAISPPLMGQLADRYGSMAVCFIIPLIGFAAPTIYGAAYPRLLMNQAMPGIDASCAGSEQ